MIANSPFDHRPDRRLGKALRELLTPKDHDAFVSQVVANARREFERAMSPSPWDVLGAWMRPGLAAAAVLVLATLAGLQNNQPVQYVTIDDELVGAAEDPEQRTVMYGPAAPDVDVVLVSGYEN